MLWVANSHQNSNAKELLALLLAADAACDHIQFLEKNNAGGLKPYHEKFPSSWLIIPGTVGNINISCTLQPLPARVNCAIEAPGSTCAVSEGEVACGQPTCSFFSGFAA